MASRAADRARVKALATLDEAQRRWFVGREAMLRYGNDSPENGPLLTRQRPLGQIQLRAVLTAFLIDAPPAEASIEVVAPRLLTKGLLSLAPGDTGRPAAQIPRRHTTLNP
jgi:hypothetical protein